MDILSITVREVISLTATFQPGAIFEAEQVVDTYLATFNGYRNLTDAIDLLRTELSRPQHRALNRGGLFEQVERHLDRRRLEAARRFQ